MNTPKIVGICNRLCVAPKAMQQGIIEELLQAVRQGENSPGHASGKVGDTIATLRNALDWPEVKDSPSAVARICRTLRTIREAS